MIDINPSSVHSVSAGQFQPDLIIKLLGGIGLMTSFYLIQKNGGSLSQILCHVGCISSGDGASCLFTLASSSNIQE